MNVDAFLEGLFWIFDVTILLYFIQKYLDRKEIKHGEIFLWTIPVVTAVFMKVVEPLTGYGTVISLLVSMTFTTILCKLIFKNPLYQILLLKVVGVIIIGVIEMLAIGLMFFVLNDTGQRPVGNTITALLPVMIMKTSTFVFFRYIHSIKIDLIKVNKKNAYQLTLLGMTNVLFISIGMSFYEFTTLSKVNVAIYSVVMVAMLIVFSILIYVVTQKIMKHTEKESEWRYKAQEYQEQIRQVKDFENIFLQSEAQRQEYEQQLKHLRGLLSEKNADAAQKHLEGLCKHIDQMDTVIGTDNPTLASLLCAKHKIASSKEIQLDYEIGEFSMDKVECIDLAIIIGSVLDNAIEVCENLTIEERKVELKVYNKGPDLCIAAYNSKKNEMDLGRSSSKVLKGAQEIYEINISNVAHVIEKYEGYIKTEVKEKGILLEITLSNAA